MKKGVFVTLEGCEGVGKSTQIGLLKEFLTERGVDFILTREPGGSKIAEQIRTVILDAQNTEMCDSCEALLYAAARAQHLHEIVIPALQAGKLVICDRFIDSTFAYQGVAKGLGAAYIDQLNELSIQGYKPNYTFFLDLAPETAFARKGGADETDRLELLGNSFHQRVYEGYITLCEREPERVIRVDASGTKAETQQKLRESFLSLGIIG